MKKKMENMKMWLIFWWRDKITNVTLDSVTHPLTHTHTHTQRHTHGE